MTGVILEVTFPFGRYAATPWFRSRREHVENVEWPPSPWRLARALLAQAYRTLGADEAAVVEPIALRLAQEAPEYLVPKSGALAYAQWMPGLAFDDANPGGGRNENGHYLLDLDRESDRLVVAWPDVVLADEQRALLGRLVEELPYIGQSVAVTDARLVSSRPPGDGWLRPSEGPREDAVTRLLVATDRCSLAELLVETGKEPTLKGQAAPPGARWIAYPVVTPGLVSARSREGARPPAMMAWVSFDGPLRPPVARLFDPPRPALDGQQLATELGRALREGLEREGRTVITPSIQAVRLLDTDGDGRAELAELRFRGSPSAAELEGLHCVALTLPVRLDGRTIWRFGCTLRFEGLSPLAEDDDVIKDDGVRAGARSDPEILRLRSKNLPLLADALSVGEATHRAILSRAGGTFGADRIPWVFSGRLSDGAVRRTTNGQHAHRHIVPGSTDATTIDRVAIWAPAGFTEAERAVLRGLWLPQLAGSPVALQPADTHPSFTSGCAWRTVTPFLPVRFAKGRDGSLVEVIGRQVRDELSVRQFPEATIETVEAVEGHRTLRSRASRRPNPPGAYHVKLRFDAPVDGPLCLGRDAHFGMGVFSCAS